MKNWIFVLLLMIITLTLNSQELDKHISFFENQQNIFKQALDLYSIDKPQAKELFKEVGVKYVNFINQIIHSYFV